MDPYLVCARIIETVCNGSVFDALTSSQTSYQEMAG
jgi:hypothetical protein